jgi:choline kinase
MGRAGALRAIILSAGQGTRLKPLTAERPKCLLPVRGEETVLECQLRTLGAAGVEEALVVVGFGAEQVEERLASRPVPGIEVTTHYNPFFSVSDNLVSCWLAQSWFDGDFLLLNGDTLFEPQVVERLLEAPEAPLTLVVNEKDQYDADDMKVSVSGGQLLSVGKEIDLDTVTGESIGLMRFAASGAKVFREALDTATRDPAALSRWYLSIIDELTDRLHIETLPITGLWWAEVDILEDLQEIREFLASGPAPGCRHGSGLPPRPTASVTSRARIEG